VILSPRQLRSDHDQSTQRKCPFEDRKDIGRLLWYLYHAALEDVGVQRSGVVILVCDDRHFDPKLEQSLPIRTIAAHHFYDSNVIDFILSFVLFLMGRELQLRCNHYTLKRYDDDQFPGKLKEFGILAAMLPTWVKGGTMEFNPEQWLEERRRRELRFTQQNGLFLLVEPPEFSLGDQNKIPTRTRALTTASTTKF